MIAPGPATVAFDKSETMPATTGEEVASFFRGRTITLRNWPRDWLRNVILELRDLARLPGNWDSYGALPIAQESILAACHIVAHLALVPGIEAPAIVGTPDGDVGLCWDGGGWSLDASVDPTGLIRYVFIKSQPPEEVEGRTRDVRELVLRLASAQG
jgi:hypothetical protein